jgi:hypothetical protein
VVPLSTSIGQTAVVSRHSESGADLFPLAAFRRAGSGVIHMLCAPLKPALEGSRIFPQVVGQTGKPSLVLRSKGGSKSSTQLRRSIQVLQHGLPAAILGNMGKIYHFVPLLFRNFCIILPFLEAKVKHSFALSAAPLPPFYPVGTGECLRLCKEKMDARNVYLTNPAFGRIQPRG